MELRITQYINNFFLFLFNVMSIQLSLAALSCLLLLSFLLLTSLLLVACLSITCLLLVSHQSLANFSLISCQSLTSLQLSLQQLYLVSLVSLSSLSVAVYCCLQQFSLSLTFCYLDYFRHCYCKLVLPCTDKDSRNKFHGWKGKGIRIQLHKRQLSHCHRKSFPYS